MSYKTVKYGKKAERRNYSRIRTEVELPNLIEIQTKSYEEFVKDGLKEVFKDVSPIENHTGDLKLYFGEHRFEEPKYNILESKLRDINYSKPLKVKVKLVNNITGEIVEQELFMGDFPFMTPTGTFVINGAERVIVSQIVRSSGVYYSKELDKKTGQTKILGQIIPTRGAWIEYEIGSKDVWYAKLDRSKKIPMTTFMRALGLSSNEEIVSLFGESHFLKETFDKDTTTNADQAVIEVFKKIRQGETVPVDAARDVLSERLFDDRRYDLQTVGRYKYNKKLDVFQRAKGLFLAHDVYSTGEKVDPITGEIKETEKVLIAKAGSQIVGEVLETLKANRDALKVTIDLSQNALKGQEYPVCEVLEVRTKESSENIVKIIGNNPEEDALHITLSDIIASMSYYFNLYDEVGNLDDIDHLGNRRLRLIGELLKNQFRIGFSKLEKNIKDRMSTVEAKDATPQNLINIKPLTSSLKEFFGSSQLSQFMDQINPLAELTQKRRISALGTGGIARDRAGVEVRDVHHSHYGRMCPIETPEGPSIGLITSLASYARVTPLGFIETPYLRVCKNTHKVTDEIVYLTADQEEEYVIASASTKLNEDGSFADEKIIARVNGETEICQASQIDYMDVSPKQIVSIATACIPFLEHDDASRALMGANMQRQAVPLINPDSPIVGTGIEHKAAHDVGTACVALESGLVEYVDAKKIVIKEDSGNLRTYDLFQFIRTNSDTALHQRPIVKEGEYVEKGDIIADGPSMKNGELALGRNVRLAFMTWDGYNYEDAVIMSEKLVKDDVYTSIHIDEYELETREINKLGKEEITRDIPNVGDEAKKNLDKNGIIIPGAEVKEGDILVGKVTPKGQTDPTPEEKIMLAILGEKSREVRDTSLRVPHGGGGVVQSVQYFSKANGDELPPSVNEVVRVYIVKKRKISEGDKMAGRHGNKGVISRIVPEEDMPFTSDGRPLDIMLNPQGVPSRMNIGQVLEIHLGIAAQKLGCKVATPVFDGVTAEDLKEIMAEAEMASDGKEVLYDGRTGEPFENRISVGVMYMIKLSHMVDDKLHARSVGPYTLVTQQPMGGKAQNGGQRFGEMEVWALEAYGAAHTLREMLTIKSDDLVGRNKVFKAIIDGEEIPEASIPESFRVLTRELQALGIHVELLTNDGENEVEKSIVDHETSEWNAKHGLK